MGTSRRSRSAAVARLAATCALVLVLFYALPVESGVAGPRLVVRSVLSIATGLAITWLIVRQVSHHIQDPDGASPMSLLSALTVGVTFFALADYTAAITYPGQFVGIATKTDALYFALATLTTVGYGDVHAAGQGARGLVCVQMVFNVGIIATGASVLTRALGTRVRDRGAGPGPGQP